MVVFEQGVPNKRNYRKFTIKSVDGQDDFASMEEVLDRRFRRWQIASEEVQKPGGKLDQAFGMLPNLLIVDGGKGQLGRAVTVLERFGLLGEIPVAGIAKQNEEIFLHGQPHPILLPRQSQGLFLVQRVRDEAHRFAITSHRKRRTKTGLASRLDTIPGIGPARRKALLNQFGSIKNIQEASLEELSSLPGITNQIAHAINEQLE